MTVGVASAELTDSERGQVRSYVEGGEPSTVARLRALIARPDLSEEQTTEVLSSAVRPQTFDASAEAYFDALLFGPSSQATRSVLAPSVVRALLSRADAVFVQQPGDPMRADVRAGRELIRIHQSVGDLLTRASATESKGVAGLQSSAKRSITRAYAEHITRHRRWLSFDNRVEDQSLLLRGLVALVLRRASEEVVDRTRTADTLALGPSARRLFIQTGTLLDDGGMGPEVRRREVADMLENVPSALEGIDLVVVGKTSRRNWETNNRVMFLRTPLGPVAPRRSDLWPAIVRSADPEAALFEAAWVASSKVIRDRLVRDPAYALRVETTHARAANRGSFGFIAPWVVEQALERNASQMADASTGVDFVASATTLLLLDVQRTVQLASMRYLSGEPESFEQVLLGLDTLVAEPQPNSEIELGAVRDGRIERVGVKLIVREGRITGLAFGEHRYEASFGSNGEIADLRRDGGPFEVGDLEQVEVPTTAEDRWEVGGTELVRLHGHPRIGPLGQHRFLMRSAESAGGVDAVYTAVPSVDHTVRCRMRVQGEHQAGVVVRASTGKSGFHGVGVMVGCDSRCTAQLTFWDGRGGETLLGGAVTLARTQPSDGFGVVLTIDGERVNAKVGQNRLEASLPFALPLGHAGWVVRPRARVSIRDWSVEARSPKP